MKTILETKGNKYTIYDVSDEEYKIIMENIQSWKLNGFGKPTVENVVNYIRKNVPIFANTMTKIQMEIDKIIQY